MGSIVALCVAFGLATAASIALLGDRQLLQGKTLSIESAETLLSDWRLWISLALGVLARVIFVATNVLMLLDVRWSESATTLTAFVTATAYIFVIVFNHILLGEVLSRQQFLGAALVMGGIVLMMWRPAT